MAPSVDTARLDRLEARAEIADLVYLYARNIRDDKAAENVHVFTPEATFEIRDMIIGDPASLATRTHLKSRDEIIAYLTRGEGAARRVLPTIQNMMIDVRGDTAFGNALNVATVWGEQGIIGEYHDSFRKVNGKWLFTARIFTIMRPRAS